MVKEVVPFSLTVMLLGEMLPPVVAAVETRKVKASSILPLDELELLDDVLDELELLDEGSELIEAPGSELSPPPPQPISVAVVATNSARQNTVMPINTYLSSPFESKQQVSSESEVILSHPLNCHLKH